MKSLKIFAIIIFFFLYYQSLSGDDDIQSKEDKMHTLKMIKMTEELKLTEKQTAVLFPLFSGLRDSLNLYQKNRNKYIEEIENFVLDESFSDSKADSVVELLKKNYKLKDNLFKNFHDKIRKELSSKQYCQYILFEDKFHKEIRKYLKERHCKD